MNNDITIRANVNFFDCSCEELAQKLIGCILVRDTGDYICKGVIVETEAYIGIHDAASHSFGSRRTARNEAMYMDAGTVYVYNIYGMYRCFNISSGDGSAVLIRALKPLEGTDHMKIQRIKCKNENNLCKGPANLCNAMNITKKLDQCDIVNSNEIWLEIPSDPAQYIDGSPTASGPRVGVNCDTKWKEANLRYYLQHSKHVSAYRKAKTKKKKHVFGLYGNQCRPV